MQKCSFGNLPDEEHRRKPRAARPAKAAFKRKAEQIEPDVILFQGHTSHKVVLLHGYHVCEKCGARAQQSSTRLKGLRNMCKHRAHTPYHHRNLVQLQRGQRSSWAKE